MRLSTAAWAEIRHAYEETTDPLAALAATWGVKPRTIQDRARREHWSQRPQSKGPRHADTGPERPTRRSVEQSAVRPTRGEQEALLARLYRAITWKLEDMEARMTSSEQRSTQDEEREARALGSLISNFEKVTDVVLDFDKSSERSARPGREPGTPRPDADEMRREIAERLERLNRGRHTAYDPREP